MTRKTSTKAVDGDHWRGRLENARAFHQAVRDAVALADPDVNANPILSNIVNATIAYADALTAKLKHMVVATLGEPLHNTVTGDSAYVVAPASMTCQVHGKRVTQSGAVFTVALRKLPEGWRIAAWAWAKGS